MRRRNAKLKLGIVGCGAIGSGIALSTQKELKNLCMVSALYDIDAGKSGALAARLRMHRVVKASLDDLIRASDVVVECVNTGATVQIVKKALRAKKSVLAMSVGRLLEQGSLFHLAEAGSAQMLLPSGSIAGLDAVKAASLAGISSVVLTSRKPPAGFLHNDYLMSKNICVEDINRETVLFDGDVFEAVKFFPQNINVAAALKLACGIAVKLRVRVIADPKIDRNVHEITLEGACGRVTTRTENTICPDNPKTSYLAVLSGIQTLKQFFYNVKIGT